MDDETLTELHNIQIEILDKIVRVCKENNDYCLKTVYGDYLKVPPKEKQITHDCVGIDFDEK